MATPYFPIHALSVAFSCDVQAGLITDSTTTRVDGIAVRSALVGDLTITGITDSSGNPQSWVIPAGTTAFSPAPGTGKSWRFLRFSYANAADAGKAVAIYKPM